ncbi:MAG: hypothetical protein BJ554DRAFT_1181 [Olpidium bornovanus]|uniref:Uncharacterized protein n=1 Tax=Olpidium bornovanus TaxID=278681 RepID=A0A8H8A115_9FUNG|nr:MAG: hypothetical protein BJ554DRAFT_1181 [Olpidium bornovanus]
MHGEGSCRVLAEQHHDGVPVFPGVMAFSRAQTRERERETRAAHRKKNLPIPMAARAANFVLRGVDAFSRFVHHLLTAPLVFAGLLPAPRPLKPLESRYVVVTGASSGIGRDAARTLRKAGFSVWAGVRKDADAESVRADGLLPLMIDVADDDSVARAFNEVAAALANQPGSMLVAVVSNAGVMGKVGPVECLPLKNVKDTFEVNVFGALRTVQAFLPLIREARGRVVVVGSVLGVVTQPGYVQYCMTKYALESLADGLRRELAPLGVTVSLLEPGPILTVRAEPLSIPPITEKYESAELDVDPSTRSLYSYVWKFGREVSPLMFNTFGVPVSFTSDAIVHAITARYPLDRYRVSWAAYFVTEVMNRLPTQVEDVAMYKMFSWMSRGS